MKFLILGLILSAVSSVSAADSLLYRETYRPRYHFTPAHRWIGDPCGTVRHNGKYLAYSWGCVESTDLVHWAELNDHAIKGVPEGISTFTGSVVADRNNTAGYGKNALIAAFTSFDENSKKQSQSIAFSHDGGQTYQYYEQNPVIDIWSTEFRDPTVIRDEKNDRWIMLVAKALEKKIAFYSSRDLKHWEWLSDFGPLGDSERSWECPDLFQLPVEGSGEKKWVMVVSVNWAREQYFIGDFDGEKFIPDNPESYPLYVDHGLDYYASRVFQDFDNPKSDDVYTVGWINTWDYAPAAPSKWGKGIWSIPRRLTLYQSGNGLRMRQLPVDALRQLRAKGTAFRQKLEKGRKEILKIADMNNSYELRMKLKAVGQDVAGINLCEGNGRKVTLTYDYQSRYLTLDRTNSTDAEIPKFDRISYLHIPGAGQEIELTLFVDKSTVEIFVNNGERVLSLLTFAADNQTGASMFSLNGNTKAELDVWPLTTIWP